LTSTIDSLNFNRLAGGYGITADGYKWQGDCNSDRKVNTLDFKPLAGGFGRSVRAPLLGALVPEAIVACSLER